MRVSRLLLGLLLIPTLALTACGDGESADPGELEERLQTAATALGEAERLDFSLSVSGGLPGGVQGLESAEGFGNRSPAFDGEVTIASGGSSLSAEVVSLDGVVWAKLGFSPEFFTIDPADYGAPDPATLIGPTGGGLAALVGEVEVSDSSSERDGSTVLTSIEGTVDGTLIAELIPSADAAADYAVTVRLTDDDAVHDITLTGQFYPDTDDVTYVVTVEPSSASPLIEAP